MPADWCEWVPVRVHWQDTEPRVEWIHCGSRRFREPFFEDSVARLKCGPTVAEFLRESGVGELERWALERPGLAPAGFIFHMSRCGSTLISQMLGAADGNRVMSEAVALDDVLRLGVRGQAGDGQVVSWLRAVMSALGQPANARERRLFVKWDCWQIHQLGVIRRAFPGVPWIFLYRDPLEVLVSQMRNPGMWTVPGKLDGALTAGADAGAGREEYVAQLLAGICRAALGSDAVLVNYTELPDVVCAQLARHFGVEFSESERQQIAAAAELDAKAPYFKFTNDAERKQRAVTPQIREAAERWMGGIYEELERRREAGKGLGDYGSVPLRL